MHECVIETFIQWFYIVAVNPVGNLTRHVLFNNYFLPVNLIRREIDNTKPSPTKYFFYMIGIQFSTDFKALYFLSHCLLNRQFFSKLKKLVCFTNALFFVLIKARKAKPE